MDIELAQQGAVLTVGLNRPAKKNALTAAMYAALADALGAAMHDAKVRVVVLQGEGDAFCAGNDIADFAANGGELGAAAPVMRFLRALADFDKPLVAAVHGAAIGIGTTMLLHCDLVYAADDASFALPFAQLGLCPEAAASLLLPQIAGYQRAAEKLLLGEAFAAVEARECGFVNRIVPSDALAALVHAQAHRLAALPVASLRATKLLLKGGQRAAVHARIDEEATQFAALLRGPAAREAFAAFAAKRRPDFSGC
jgi:enoyl-CoA hydratase/carnithine racemase